MGTTPRLTRLPKGSPPPPETEELGGLLSIAMIVKNESTLLPECLHQLRAFADEICVVDTGSTDGTPELLRAAGCKVQHVPWQDDFSAARNASLELCQCPAIFVLDADERISGGGWEGIRQLALKEPGRCFRFTTRNYTHNTALAGFAPEASSSPWARGFPGWHPSTKVRLFPNRPGVHFEGEVHELVNASLERLGVPMCTSEIPIHHYPLLRGDEAVRQKHQLYLRLGQRKAARDTHSAQARAELGAQYAEMGRYPESADAYRAALRIAPSNAAWWCEFGSMLQILGKSTEARSSLEMAIKLDPELCTAWRNLGVHHASRQDWEAAIEHFQAALRLEPGHSENHRYLAVAWAGRGNAESAAAAAREALTRNPGCAASRALFAEQMHLLERDEDAAKYLEALDTPNVLERSPQPREQTAHTDH